MSDKPLLSARIERSNETHAFIGVFNRGGKAGVLTVNAEDAAEILTVLVSPIPRTPAVAYDKRQVDKRQARAVWSIVKEVVGVDPDGVTEFQFVDYLSNSRHGEFRLAGSFGFGGKLYFDWPTILRVGYYHEDETPERLSLMVLLNAELTLLLKEWKQ